MQLYFLHIRSMIRHMKKRVAVIGGMNFDINGTIPNIIWKDSNPGIIRTSIGGVGRNIAENLARLDVSVSLYSFIGNDAFGDAVYQHTKNAGVLMDHVERLPDVRTGVYFSLSDNEDMVVALNDTMATERMDVPWATRVLGSILEHDMVFLDAGLIKETIDYIAYHCRDKIIMMDSVSVSKAKRIIDAIPHCHTLKPNVYELHELTQLPVQTEEDIIYAASTLVARGCNEVIVTRGKHPLLQITATGTLSVPIPPSKTVNLTGAGDAFIAAYAAGLLYEAPNPMDWAIKASAITIASDDTVSPELSLRAIKGE
jgi:pseudouridine kinase